MYVRFRNNYEMCSFIYFYNFNALLPKADELHLDGLLADSSFSKTIPPKFEFCNVAIIKNTTLMTGTDSMNRSTSCWRARRGSACGVFVGQCSDSQLIMSEIERYTKHATAMKLQQLHEGCNGFQPPFSDEDIATKINAIRLMVAQIQCQQPFYFHSIAITDSIPVAFAFLLLLTFSFLSLVVTFGFSCNRKRRWIPTWIRRNSPGVRGSGTPKSATGCPLMRGWDGFSIACAAISNSSIISGRRHHTSSGRTCGF